MNAEQIVQWKINNDIDEDLKSLIQNTFPLFPSSSKNKVQISPSQKPESNRSQPAKLYLDETTAAMETRITQLMVLDSSLRDCEELLQRNRTVSRDLNDSKSAIYSKIATISNSSSELFTERSNLSHLRLEIELNRSFYIDMESVKLKMAFFEQVTSPTEFYKYADKYTGVVQKICQAWAFFSNRKGYKDSQEQLDRYDLLLKQTQASIFSIFTKYFSQYFDCVKQGLTILSLNQKDFADKAYPGSPIELRQLMMAYFKSPQTVIKDHQTGALEPIFELCQSKSEINCRDILKKLISSLEVETGMVDKLKDLFSFFFTEKAFDTEHKKFVQAYLQGYFLATEKAFECFANNSGSLDTTIETALDDLLFTVANLQFNLTTKVFKFDGLFTVFSAHISNLLNTIKQKLKAEDDFEKVLQQFRLILRHYKSGTTLASIDENDPGSAKLSPSQVRSNLLGILLPMTTSADDQQELLSSLNFYAQQLVLELAEAFLFHIEYMLNKILNQQSTTANLRSEIAGFDLKSKSPISNEFSKAYKIFVYISNSIRGLEFGQAYLKPYLVRFLTSAIKRNFEATPLLEDDLLRFAFKTKNLHGLYCQLDSEEPFETLYEFLLAFSPEKELISRLDKESSKYSAENAHFLCAYLLGAVINNEIARLVGYLMLEAQKPGETSHVFLRSADVFLNEMKLKLNFGLDADTKEALRATFLPGLLNFLLQQLKATGLGKNAPELENQINELFISIFFAVS